MPKKIIKAKKNGKEYYPCQIHKFHQYRKMLDKIFAENPELDYIGAIEYPNKRAGIIVYGTNKNKTFPIDIFYTIREIENYSDSFDRRDSVLKQYRWKT